MLFRNVSITMLTSFVSTGAAALAAVVVANALGAAGAGTFALARVVPNLVALLLGAGITIANPYLIGAGRYPVQAITETNVALASLLSIIGLAGWIACGDVLHAHFFATLSDGATLVLGLSIPLQILRNYLNAIQQGLQHFRAANVVLFIEDLATLLLVLPLLGGVTDAPSVIVVACVGGSALSCLASAAALAVRRIWPWPRLHRAIAAEAIVFGAKGHVGRIASLLNWRLDLIILSTLASVEVVGYYAVASKLAEAFRPLSNAFTFVLRPLIASLPVAEARARGVLLYRRVFALNFALVLIMAVAGGPIIIHLFGREFAAAIPAFQILLIGLAALGGEGVLNGYNVGIGRPELNSYAALVALAVTVMGDLLLIPSYGLLGAAIASTAAYTIKAVALSAVFLATAGVTLPELIGMKEYTPDLA
jgi:O-antigen/teichoic acid export membrane protein